MSTRKGYYGEKTTQFGLWLFLNKKYTRLHDLIVEIDGTTTQIDHVCLSRYGIFVIETKNYSGWIFGSAEDRQWTQVFKNRAKYRFQNPLFQNRLHTRAISKQLGMSSELVHSIIVFISSASNIKTELPANVTNSPFQAARYIKSFREEFFTDAQVQGFAQKLAEMHPTAAIARKHKRDLKKRGEGKDSCPKCGRGLVQRIVKKGANKGNVILACPGYPKCRHIVDAPPVASAREVPTEEIDVQEESDGVGGEPGACPKCGSAMEHKVAAKGRHKGKELLACTSYPKCRHYTFANGTGKEGEGANVPGPGKDEAMKPVTDDMECPRCGNDLVERTAKRGEKKGSKFVGCSAYPKCRYVLYQGRGDI